jgi:tetratricopeptide (TPR) repeat protein
VSPRTRVALVVAGLAALAAVGVVGAALLQDTSPSAVAPTSTAMTTTAVKERPALELAVIDRDDSLARGLRTAERRFEQGRRTDATKRFADLESRYPESVEAQIGAAVVAWPDGTTGKLMAIARAHPESAVAHLNLGLAHFADGDPDAARAEWREAERREPDSPAALRAEDLLNPRSPPGRPRFLAPGFPEDVGDLTIEERLAELERRADSGGVDDWLHLGQALEQAGHRVSAQQAYDKAVDLDPEDLDARVASAVARFDKDDLSKAFSRLGPLAAEQPDAAVVRFHLGLMLLWLPDLPEAREQLEAARTADAAGFYGEQAARILEQLDTAGR